MAYGDNSWGPPFNKERDQSESQLVASRLALLSFAWVSWAAVSTAWENGQVRLAIWDFWKAL